MFKDRFDAGQKLALALQQYKNNPYVLVLAIPRGAVEIGSVLSKELQLPLDVILTKKIGYPGNPEYAIGAMSIDNVIIDRRALEFSGQMETFLKQEILNIREYLRECSAAYHGQRAPLSCENKIVIITDDGMATGKTLEVTIELIKKQHPQKIIVAVPVASKEALHLIKKNVDEVVCLEVPDMFMGVSQWYQKFEHVEDEQAIALLQGSLK